MSSKEQASEDAPPLNDFPCTLVESYVFVIPFWLPAPTKKLSKRLYPALYIANLYSSGPTRSRLFSLPLLF
jgi:hypothetical protein